ncbi:hypothetical protein Tco_0577409, partial [Tanacetum coccineum]
MGRSSISKSTRRKRGNGRLQMNLSLRPIKDISAKEILELVEFAHPEKHLHLNVYEMLCDRSGWFVKYQVELDELSITYPE